MDTSARSPADPPAPDSRNDGDGGLDAYLAGLGERVRAARARRGMSRRILSRASGVSERYLAQLETGKGNISIALLRKVAEAMSVPLADLVREGSERPVDLTLLIRKLERLQPDELAEANRLLTETLGLGETAHRMDRIALTGLRGAGKTTLGAALAQRLDVPFIEMAREIERTAGMSVDQIFDLSGPGRLPALRAPRPGRRAGGPSGMRDRDRRQHRFGTGDLRTAASGMLHRLAARRAGGPYAPRPRTGRYPPDGEQRRGDGRPETHSGNPA